MNNNSTQDRFICVGIFTDERVLQFLNILQMMSDRIMHDLHVVAAKSTSKSIYFRSKYYQKWII